MATSNADYIQKELIPLLVAEGKLTDSQEVSNKIKPILKSVRVEQLNTKESFMLTMCYRVKVMLEENGKDTEYSLIVKKTPRTPDDVYDSTGFDKLFSNEITAYTATLPAMGDTKKYAKYYYSYRKESEALIVLEDFSIYGWKMSQDKYNLSLEHVLLAVQALGRFHGQGYALKLSQPDKFQSLISMFHKSRYETDPPESWAYILNVTFQRYSKVIDESELPSLIPEEFLDQLKEMSKDFVLLAKLSFRPIEPFATICHGDYLRNNIAFKYDEKDMKTPIDVLMFDFQTIIYSSPMVDLTTFMALSAGRDSRTENFEKVFKAYWDTLIQNVCENGKLKENDLPEFLSYESMLREYIKYLPFGIRIASFFLMEMVEPMEASPEDFVGDLDAVASMFDALERGGETVNAELRLMVKELYDMCQRYDVDLFEHYDKMKSL